MLGDRRKGEATRLPRRDENLPGDKREAEAGLRGNLPEKGVYLITDRLLSHAREEEAVKAACKAGIRMVQYREKELSFKEQTSMARKLRRICSDYGTTFIVNDSVEIALSSNADGVHLGQDDFSEENVKKAQYAGLILGISASNLQEAQAASEFADYIGFGPVFSTQTKKDAAKPAGIFGLSDVIASVKKPIYAIGGINEKNASKIMQTGAHGIAVISAIMASNDFYSSSKKLLKTVEKWI
nr:thiamine-phosphate synthase [uncultured archaeon]